VVKIKDMIQPKFIIFIIIIFAFVFNICKLNGQTAADSISPTFPKVLFVKKNNDVLLYYDEHRKAYEVPSNGFIEGPMDFAKYIDSLAKDLGVDYDGFRLGGLFTYIYPNSYSTFIRPYFVVSVIGNKELNLKDPKCKWFTLDYALKEIKYPASRMITEKLLTDSISVWMATFEEYGYTNPVDERKIKFRVLADFSRLNGQ
jgi:hypothetical protein